MRYMHIILSVVIMAVVLLFVFQNTGTSSVSFLSASVELPLSILVLLTYAMGVLTGGFVVSFLRALIKGTIREKNNA